MISVQFWMFYNLTGKKSMEIYIIWIHVVKTPNMLEVCGWGRTCRRKEYFNTINPLSRSVGGKGWGGDKTWRENI